MKTLIIFLSLIFVLPNFTEAQSLNQYRWKSRLILLFTPSPSDPLFERQVKLLYEQMDAFTERNMIFMMITPDGKFENTGRFLKEATAHKFYQDFGVERYQFEMIMVGLDGYEKFRSINRITPTSVLLNLIDGMPMRKRELMQGYTTKSTSNGYINTTAGQRRNF